MNVFKKLLHNAQFERYFLFFINIYIFHIYGFLTGSFGITLGQFGKVLDLNTKDLSLGLSCQAIFGCVASLLATYTLDKWNRDLQYAIDVLLLSIVIILFPFSTSSTDYLLYSSLIGFFTSVINCVNTIWTLELFRDNPSFFIQILFFFYPLGATFSRFLFSPFLDNSQLPFYNQTIVNDTVFVEPSIIRTNSDSSIINFFQNFFQNVDKTNIWIPYLVVGILMMLGSFMIFFVHFVKPFPNFRKPYRYNSKYIKDFNNPNNNYEKDAKKEESNNDSIKDKNDSIKSKESDLNQEEAMSKKIKATRKQRILSIIFVTLVCLITTLQVGCEINFVNFVPTFLTRLSSFDFTEMEASYISVILTGCVTIGRFVNIFLSLKIETEFMIYVNFLLMLAGNLILIFSSKSVELIWTGIGLIGLGFSSTYPLIIAFVEKRYMMTNSLSSLLEFSCLFFVCFSPIAFGHILDSKPDYFIYINTFTNLFIIILFVSLNFLGNFRKS